MTSSPRLLRDLIAIPESVHQGDLVFHLADAADAAAKTVAEYVVTKQLRTSFLDAVELVRTAVAEGSSKAAYLHGSFGSGKSNFLGMLQLLLDGNTAARAVPELAPVVDKLDEWKGDRRFLTVPFHLIGETDLESAVFGQYVRFVAHHHPDAPPPAVFADEPVLVNADELRTNVGDETFFAKLSAAPASSGWGTMSALWDGSSYDAARQARSDDPERVRLVQAVLTTWLTSFAEVAQANRGGYVSFEDGLSALSHHAKSLGYDGLLLFLDELILWFISRLADTAWVSDQASKLSELVEAASAGRPVPIVSLIARQRDLRELVGDKVPGAEKMSFADQLDYQQGRFDTIKLDDSNLPVVANRRLLQPINEEAAAELADAFKGLSLSPRVRDALLAEDGTEATFALTYPFSPAFMTVLVDVAGALQRTRTGLRVLLDLLVARRDVLEVGQLVPVGDLYDVIARSDDPFSDAMRSAFDQARKIYTERLRPALLADHHLNAGSELTTAFVNDDRLVKTLLLAALVPQSAPFKDLTVEGLVALNHGVISSPIAGQETNIATNKLKRLASQAGELRVGSDPNNPTVSVVLADVDTGSILATADGIDNTANRRTLLRELVQEALALPGHLQSTYTLVWKGLPRTVTVLFNNIRDTGELPDNSFANPGPEWKLIIDFPFDDPGHTIAEDLERLDRFRQNSQSWNTLCWLPAFFTAPTLDVLGRLVRLNHVLASDQRFTEATASLSPVARASAKPLLQAMQQAARSQLEAALLGAYGVVGADEKVVDRSHSLSDHFPSLKAGLTIAAPTKANLKDALDQVLDQALRHTYPGAPELESEVKPADVRKVAALCADAVVEPDGRLVVNDTADRRLLARVANPLELGVQSEQAFKLADTAERWDTAFTKAIGAARQNGADAVAVALLRQAIDTKPMGLTTQLQNLIILVWAQATSHTFREHGGPVHATVDRIDDHWEVQAQPLPDPAVWEVAHTRLAVLFGVPLASRALSGFAVERAGIELAKVVADHRADVDALVSRLTQRMTQLAHPTGGHRMATAQAAQRLFAALGAAPDDLAKVAALAAAEIPTSELALSKSIATAAGVGAELDAAPFDIITAAMGTAAGASLGHALVSAMEIDEFVVPLAPALLDAKTAAIACLSAATPVATVEPTVIKPAPPVPERTWKGSDLIAARTVLEQLGTQQAAGDDVEVTITWDVRDVGDGPG